MMHSLCRGEGVEELFICNWWECLNIWTTYKGVKVLRYSLEFGKRTLADSGLYSTRYRTKVS